MKVKVSPPFEGAGSWESEVVLRRPVKIAMDGEVIIAHLLKGGVQVPASWCEPIPEITPEPGDIVEGEDGLPFFYDPVKTVECCARSRPRRGAGTKEAGDDPR